MTMVSSMIGTVQANRSDRTPDHAELLGRALVDAQSLADTIQPAWPTAQNPVLHWTKTVVDSTITTEALVSAFDIVDPTASTSLSTAIIHPDLDINERIEELEEKPSRTLTVLKGMEKNRDIQARPGREVDVEKRAVNHEAALAHTWGTIMRMPCESYDRGPGPFQHCIRLSGLLEGNCTNCHYSAAGTRCSLRYCK